MSYTYYHILLMEKELLDLNSFVYYLNEDFVTLYLIEIYEEAIEAYANGSSPTDENINILRSLLIYKILSYGSKETYAVS